MGIRGKVPAWIQRRMSARPVARWINWDAGRPQETRAATPALRPAPEPKPGDNVVPLFRRTG